MHTSSFKILGIAGSLREQSINGTLLRSTAALLPEGVTLEVFPLHAIPLYNQDVDNDDMRPVAIGQFVSAIREADALLIATPEYNFGVPGVLKNALDWASRPVGGSRAMTRKPTGVMGAAPGLSGAMRAQESLKLTLLSMGAQVFPHGGVAVTQAKSKFDGQGALVDEKTVPFVERYLADFVDWARKVG